MARSRSQAVFSPQSSEIAKRGRLPLVTQNGLVPASQKWEVVVPISCHKERVRP
jgi:hypothetical protein